MRSLKCIIILNLGGNSQNLGFQAKPSPPTPSPTSDDHPVGKTPRVHDVKRAPITSQNLTRALLTFSTPSLTMLPRVFLYKEQLQPD
ncbi:Uncharacterized protein HZ326_20176 [Fusarium oxysporum f. sp. albedinis]|nr:Uncharacterized protein HZ326_20176 [Fusarium oxysporum f. sp. albedinis]